MSVALHPASSLLIYARRNLPTLSRLPKLQNRTSHQHIVYEQHSTSLPSNATRNQLHQPSEQHRQHTAQRWCGTRPSSLCQFLHASHSIRQAGVSSPGRPASSASLRMLPGFETRWRLGAAVDGRNARTRQYGPTVGNLARRTLTPRIGTRV